MQTPSDLKKPGRDLWNWLTEAYDIDGLGPLVAELCRVQDRLAAVRLELSKGELVAKTGGRHPLLDSEFKLSGAFMRLWRTAGFSDDPPPPTRDVGRPAGGRK
jgi:hypothetical protein